MQESAQKTAQICATQCAKYISSSHAKLQCGLHLGDDLDQQICSGTPSWCSAPIQAKAPLVEQVKARSSKRLQQRKSRAFTPQTPRSQTPPRDIMYHGITLTAPDEQKSGDASTRASLPRALSHLASTSDSIVACDDTIYHNHRHGRDILESQSSLIEPGDTEETGVPMSLGTAVTQKIKKSASPAFVFPKWREVAFQRLRDTPGGDQKESDVAESCA